MADMSAFEQLDSLIREQKNQIHALNETLKEVDITVGSGGVGETIEPGTQYTYQGTTYTVGTNVERFNLYGEDGDGTATNQAAGSYSHVEGYNNKALSDSSHAEGYNTAATGIYSHSEGYITLASGDWSHVEGYKSAAYGDNSHAEGCGATLIPTAYLPSTVNDIMSMWQSANVNIAYGAYSHVEGEYNAALGDASHAEGQNTSAVHLYAHSEGLRTSAYGVGSHAEGWGDNIFFPAKYGTELNNIITTARSDPKNLTNVAYGRNSHTEGANNIASGDHSHAEGSETLAYLSDAHAEGYKTTAYWNESHAEGYSTNRWFGSKYGYTLDDIINAASSDHINIAFGWASHSEGQDTIAGGNQSHAEGLWTISYGTDSHAEGDKTTAYGSSSHAEGRSVYSYLPSIYGTTADSIMNAAINREILIAFGEASHAEGRATIATGLHSHAEGWWTIARGDASHSEGDQTTAYGNYSHAEGSSSSSYSPDKYGKTLDSILTAAESYPICIAFGEHSHVEGTNCIAGGWSSHAEGSITIASGQCSHAEGTDNSATGDNSHAEGYNATASGGSSHAEGSTTIASGQCSHAEGYNNTINSSASDAHVEGFGNTVSGVGSHAEGSDNTIGANANSAHAEGYSNTVTAAYAHVEGYSCDVYGGNAHAEGCDTLATGVQSHAEGNQTQAHGAQSHVEGSNTVCAGTATSGHAEGHASVATGDASHAQNESTRASGSASTAMGDHSVASGSVSTAMGYYTIANGTNQLALGRCNISDTNSTYAMIIGNGIDTSNRSDAFKVDWDGKIYVGDNDGVDVSGLNVTSSDNNKVLTASYQNGVGTYSWQDAPESSACIVHTYTDTSLPTKVVLDNNNEYRYINLTNANSLTISIETIDTTKSFYSTIVLHNVSSTNSLSTFVTVSGDSVISNIIFLNENNVDLSTADTAELLFFTNGMSDTVMCIAYAYGTSTPPTPPTPSYDESKIFVIELDENHDDTTNITEHATLASAKTQLDTNYSTDPSKMYKLFIGDDAFDPPIGIDSTTSTFEDCLNLYNADIGESINYFYSGAFCGCTNLTIMSVPYAVTHMVGYNIQRTNIPSLTVHSNFMTMTGMIDYIFYDNNLTELTIDAAGTVYLAMDDPGINSLSSDVFGSASYLGDTSGTPTKPITITFGENVTGIVANTEGYIFGYNNQYGVTVNIPNSVTSISSSFLLGISELVGNITVNIDNTNGAIPGAPWGAGSASNLTINYLR